MRDRDLDHQPESPRTEHLPQDEDRSNAIGRRSAMKIGFINLAALAATAAYEKPALATTPGGALSPILQSFTWQRNLPAMFFPATITPSAGGCNPSQYRFSGTVSATTVAGTITVTNLDLTGTLQSGDDLGTIRIVNVGNLTGNVNNVGCFTSSGQVRYTDAFNPEGNPIDMMGASLIGTIVDTNNLRIRLDGGGAGFCSGAIAASVAANVV